MSNIKIQICLFAFDILYLNGRPLLKEQLNVRREVCTTTSYRVSIMQQWAICFLCFQLIPILSSFFDVQLMYSSFQEVPGVFKFATAKNSNDLEEIQKFLDDAINDRSVIPNFLPMYFKAASCAYVHIFLSWDSIIFLCDVQVWKLLFRTVRRFLFSLS